jgi:hypothetical protein
MNVHAISITTTEVSDSEGMDAVLPADLPVDRVLADGAYTVAHGFVREVRVLVMQTQLGFFTRNPEFFGTDVLCLSDSS